MFVIDVVDPPPVVDTPAANNHKECILRLTPTFTTVDDVWRTLLYLMPDGVDTDDEDTHDLDGVERAATRVQEWLAGLVSVAKSQDDDGHFRYTVTLDKQDCAPSGRANDLTVKLQKMGVDYHLIKIVR